MTPEEVKLLEKSDAQINSCDGLSAFTGTFREQFSAAFLAGMNAERNGETLGATWAKEVKS